MQFPLDALGMTSGRGSPDLVASSSNLESTINRYAPRSAGGRQSGAANNDQALENEVEKMAARDPIAAQVWRMYARTKATLPHAQRMENLTWRMMTMALKRRNEEEGKSRGVLSPTLNLNLDSGQLPLFGPLDASATAAVAGGSSSGSEAETKGSKGSVETPTGAKGVKVEDKKEEQATESRGRRPDKTTVRVVGFEGKSQDGEDAE